MMNPKRTLLSIALTFLTAAFVSGATYAKFEGVDGESTDKAHQGWVDVQSVSGLSAASQVSTSTKSSGQQQVVLVRELDKSSTKLAQVCTPGTDMGAVTVSSGSETYVMANSTVVSCVTKGNTQTITLSSSKITVKPIRLEVQSSAAPVPTGSSTTAPVVSSSVEAGSGTGKATDYNSSRSNRTTN